VAEDRREPNNPADPADHEGSGPADQHGFASADDQGGRDDTAAPAPAVSGPPAAPDLTAAAPGPGPGPASDDAALAGYARALADGVDWALAGWVARSVERVLHAQGRHPDAATRQRAAAAGDAARAEIVPRLRRLLEADIDDQRTTPLAVIRGAVPHPTGVLRAAGARPVARDDPSRRHFPDDVYDLAPASFADLDPSLREPGLEWGAAKAHVHLRRRRAEGRR
jgi:hypothetical protein